MIPQLGVAAKMAHEANQQRLTRKSEEAISEQDMLAQAAAAGSPEPGVNGSNAAIEPLVLREKRLMHKEHRTTVFRSMAVLAVTGCVGAAGFTVYKGVQEALGIANDGVHAVEKGVSAVASIPSKIADVFTGSGDSKFNLQASLNNLEVPRVSVLASGSGIGTGRVDVDGGLCPPVFGCLSKGWAQETRKVAVELRAKNPSQKEKAIDIIPQHIEGAPDDKGWEIVAKVHVEDLSMARVNPETALNADRRLDVKTSGNVFSTLVNAGETTVTLGKHQDQRAGRNVAFLDGAIDKGYEARCGKVAMAILDAAVGDNARGTIYYNIDLLKASPKLSPSAKNAAVRYYTTLAKEDTPVRPVYVVGKGANERPVSLLDLHIPDANGAKEPTRKEAAQLLGIKDEKHVTPSIDAPCTLKPTALNDERAIMGKQLRTPEQ